jgi:hypothetical protein
MNNTQRSSTLRVSRQPWFGVVIALVIIAAVIAGSFGLKAFGDSRTDSSASDIRGAAESEANLPVNIDLVNSSSVTVVVDVTNVKREDWGYPAPDSEAPNGLRGAWIDPGQSVSVTLSIDNMNTRHAPFNLSTTPIAGSSSGGAITFYSQMNLGEAQSSPGSPSFWSWPTRERPAEVTKAGCSPVWSEPAGNYVLRDGRQGSITATATCRGVGETTTIITFTDAKS